MNYKFDVFLSWTGADRELKNDLKRFLCQKSIEKDPDTPIIKQGEIYDSDENCMSGEFRIDYVDALCSSKTYVMILSDAVLNDPNLTKAGVFSEVRKEGNLAADLEARGELNIVILNLTSKFCNPKYSDFSPNDLIGKHFFSLLQLFL